MRMSLSAFPPILMAIFCAGASLPAQAQDIAPDNGPAAKLRMEAIAYENGEGVARNPVLAATLYCMAATRAAFRHFTGQGLGWKQRVYGR